MYFCGYIVLVQQRLSKLFCCVSRHISDLKYGSRDDDKMANVFYHEEGGKLR